jgi:hypothetical protein
MESKSGQRSGESWRTDGKAREGKAREGKARESNGRQRQAGEDKGRQEKAIARQGYFTAVPLPSCPSLA